MNDFNIISILPGLLVVVFVIIAQGYWKEAIDFYWKALNKKNPIYKRKEYALNYRRALFMFRINCIGMLLCLLAAIFPIYFSGENIITFLKVLLAIASIILIILLILLISKKFIVKYLTYKKLIEKIEEDTKSGRK